MRKVDDTYCCHFDRISRLPVAVAAADLRSANDAVHVWWQPAVPPLLLALVLTRAGAGVSGR